MTLAVDKTETVVSTYATGTIEQQVKLFSGRNTKSIFLYEVVLQDKKDNLHNVVSHIVVVTKKPPCVEFSFIILLHEWVDRGQMHQL